MCFEPSLFLCQPVDENLSCSLCLGVYDKPSTACSNGHVYCLDCLSKTKERSNACPDCRQDMLDPAPLNRPLENMISGLKLCCENSVPKKKEGDPQEPPATRRRTTESGKAVEGDKEKKREEEVCEWQGLVSDYRQHIKSCPFRIVKCPLKCHAKIEYRFLDHHKEHECPYRRVTCDRCGRNNIHLGALDYHQLRHCPESDVKCRYCQLEMKRKELGKFGLTDAHTDNCIDNFSGHYKVCPKCPVRCEFWDVGCRHEGPREQMTEHHAQKARYHAKLVNDTVKWQSTRISWDVAARHFMGAPSCVIDSPSVTVFGTPYKFFARLYLAGESVEIELCIDGPHSQHEVALRAVSISATIPDGTECVAKDLEIKGRARSITVASDISSVGKSKFVFERDDSDNDEGDRSGETTTEVEVTRAMFIDDDVTFSIKFDVSKQTSHYLETN